MQITSPMLRRFEVHFPLVFEDGRPVSRELVGDAIVDRLRHFGKCLIEAGVPGLRGFLAFLDVPDAQQNREFMLEFKKQLGQRFPQIHFNLTTYLVEVI